MLRPKPRAGNFHFSFAFILPVIGALSIVLFIGDGILTAAIEWYLGYDVALFAQG